MQARNPCEKADLACACALNVLPAREMAAAEAHIAACADCQRELESLRPVVGRLASWPTDVLRPTASLQDRLAHRIAEETGKAPVPPQARLWSEPQWQQVVPGIECKPLASDTEWDRISMLVRLAPDASYPAHRHAGVEELHLLDGELWIDGRKLVPGDYNYGAPGARDERVWSETGCSCVLVTSTEDLLQLSVQRQDRGAAAIAMESGHSIERKLQTMSGLIDPRRSSLGLQNSSAIQPQERQADYLDRLAAFSERIPSLSPAAFGIGLACLVLATAVRFVAGWSFSDLRYVTYLPAILATGLLAGVPAAIVVMSASILIVAWAFIPPYFAFKWLDYTESTTVIWSVFASLCTIFFAQGCRLVLMRLRAREASNRVMVQELAHRGRNIFAVIEVILQKTLRDYPEHATALLGRLRAIRYANELLIAAADQPIDLRTLLLQEFAPYGEKQVEARGPQVEVEPEAARHLVLLFHELVTNAAKYGALSSPAGRILVRWHQSGGGLILTWTEVGGPRVQAPTGHGFGSQLISVCTRALSGTFDPQFLPEGFCCSITLSTALTGMKHA